MTSDLFFCFKINGINNSDSSKFISNQIVVKDDFGADPTKPSTVPQSNKRCCHSANTSIWRAGSNGGKATKLVTLKALVLEPQSHGDIVNYVTVIYMAMDMHRSALALHITCFPVALSGATSCTLYVCL